MEEYNYGDYGKISDSSDNNHHYNFWQVVSIFVLGKLKDCLSQLFWNLGIYSRV